MGLPSMALWGQVDYSYSNGNRWSNSLATAYYTAPDGTETEFVDTLTGCETENSPFFVGPFTNRGTGFHSVDGSGAVVTTASAVVDNPVGCGTGAAPIGGTMTLRDGTTYTFFTSPSYAGYHHRRRYKLFPGPRG
jgi:hypothetical protein